MNITLDGDVARVASCAAARLKAKSGININRLVAELCDELQTEDTASIRAALIASWDQINIDAGLGAARRFSPGIRITGFELIDLGPAGVDMQLPGTPCASAVLTAAQQQVAGTEAARDQEIGNELFAVHGPEYWDIPPDARIRDAAVFRMFTEPLVRWQWVLDDGLAKLRGISGAEIEALPRPGENRELPALRPGDCLVNGGGGDPSHVALYAGPDEDGHPMIIHAMATINEGRSAMERVGDAIKLPFQKIGAAIGFDTGEKTGVLHERLGDFFDRYHRDTVIVVRLPGLDSAQIERGLARAKELIGTDYDYKLQAGTDAIYCTEVYLEFLRAAVGNDRSRLPYIGTSCHSHSSPLGTIGVKEQFIAEPSHVMVSPHMEIGVMLGGGAGAYRRMKRTHLLGPNAKRTLAT